MIYIELLKALEEAKIRYVIVGGVAVMLHGFVRATMDLDLIVSLEPSNARKFLDIVQTLGYRPKAPVALNDFADPAKRKEWKENKGMIVFSLHHSKRFQELVDIFVDEPIPFDELYSRRVKVSLDDCSIPIASKMDLRILKLKSGRPQDLEDIKALDRLDQEGKP